MTLLPNGQVPHRGQRPELALRAVYARSLSRKTGNEEGGPGPQGPGCPLAGTGLCRRTYGSLAQECWSLAPALHLPSLAGQGGFIARSLTKIITHNCAAMEPFPILLVHRAMSWNFH